MKSFGGTQVQTVSTDVLVVGAGPAGLTAAVCLAQAGVRVVALSRYSGTAPQPRASFTNQRTMEVFRDIGIESDVRLVSTPGLTMGHNVMAASLTGPEIMRYQTYGVGERLTDYHLASPCEFYNSPQHVLEPVMFRAALDRGADVRFSHEMLSIEQNDEEVVARILDHGTGEEYLIRAAYAIGADGGRSRVAEQVGLPFEGESSLMHMINAWIEVDLSDYTAYRPGGIYMVFQPGGGSWVGSGSFVNVRQWDDWVLVREYDASEGEPDTSDEAVIAAARILIGDPNIPVKVKGTSKWQVNNMVAKEYRRGRVFIAGDAAHRHSPAGGLGSNTCIQDSYNLAWKLAFVLKGKAGPGLLDSYHDERQPIGKQIVDRAMLNLRNKSAVAEVLGLRRGQSAEDGWASLRSLFSDEPGAAERREALAVVRSLQHARSNAHGIALGQRYTSCAVIDDGTPFPNAARDPEVYYQPTTHPGARLPHVWVERDRKRLSMLDLAGHGRFCLIVGIGGAPWAEAAASLSAEFDVQLPVFAVGYRCEYDDVLGEWARLREIDDRGALLVRPDQHIAWRSFTRPSSPYDALADALRQTLALGSK
ncbi:MAG TPA: FAD-dependent monooxygenase [Paraburkholderia sp.]|uniref:FAD-dependent monooxygenase n=1 Tax=Paraburkholderia sp. TaxID=1926495 RepID=UPI002B49FACD|nr:FAD-dependent monooxygenase [Paraburkholderia sp.]HKR47693.1 FAD-dependent monooxygenase [Paraburkholderia sp.]